MLKTSKQMACVATFTNGVNFSMPATTKMAKIYVLVVSKDRYVQQ